MSELRVKVSGGLGNQLFKALTAIEFAKKLECNLSLDISWYNMRRKHNDPVSSRKFEINSFSELTKAFKLYPRTNPSGLDFRLGQLFRRIDKRISAEFGYITDANYANVKSGKKNYVLDGNFENWRLLPPDAELKTLLRFSQHKSEWFHQIYKQIGISKFIAIHIRRGDYLRLPGIYDVLTPDYYLNSIGIVREEVGNLPIVLFSDDSQGALRWISNKFQVDFIVPNALNESSVEILELMSMATVIVCAHSTFSWWSAKIGTLTNTTTSVILPRRFFSHNNQTNHNLKVPGWIIVDV